MDDEAEEQEPAPKKKAPALSTEELEAAATHEAGGPKEGLGILFVAAGVGLALLLSLVAVLGYFAMKP